MPITPLQIKLIHIAAGKAGCDEAQYRLILHNVGGVESCKALTQTRFEDCMAVFEDMGFEDKQGGWHWRQKVKLRGTLANERLVFKIFELSERCSYSLNHLIMQQSAGRTREPSKLTPREAHNVIEGLKAMIRRDYGDAPNLMELANGV